MQVQIVLETCFEKFDHMRHGRVLLDEFAAGFSLFLNGSKSMKLSFTFQVFTEFVGMGRGRRGGGVASQSKIKSSNHHHHHHHHYQNNKNNNNNNASAEEEGDGEEEGALSFENMQRYLRSFILALFNLSFTRKGPCLDVQEAVDRATEGANPEP